MKPARHVFQLTAALLLLTLVAGTAAYASNGPAVFGHGSSRGYRGPGHDRGAAVVSLESGPYGPVLVVGGAGAGYVAATSTTPASYNFPAGSSLYFATIDPPINGRGFGQPYMAGCTTTVNATVGFACTGSASADISDWPALTTDGPPVAGPGVHPWLLGSVYRADLGAYQVTYAGRPLYLFDPGPDSFTGADFLETVAPLPPWHTAWFLMSPDGLAATGPANLEAEAPNPETKYTSAAVGVEMLPGVIPGGAAITTYSFSGDSPWQSRCVGACAMEFVPVLTSGTPTESAGINARGVGEIVRSDGSHQVTYDGHPLYIYSQEQALVDGSGNPITTGTVGNANGMHAFGGIFRVVNA